ncbi:hypothetical protein PMZ80_005015 [Knufia obscura]|uniref:Maintenance of telomere capping protein 1 n=1 Tax=Knufia obscura TaxID=1635080 RepID=A0ABR0RPD3_9EURO|nr:hypothetical protein PMZ80_005015 [Knufia obscura]
MPPKASNNPDDLLAQLDDLSTQPQSRSRPPRPTTARAPKSNHGTKPQSQNEQDLLAELGNLAQRPASRPGTPSLRSSARPGDNASPRRAATPTIADEKTALSDRKSADSARSSGNGTQAYTPATTTADDSPAEEPTPTPAPAPAPAAQQQQQQQATTGGGWGGWFTTLATQTLTTAQTQVKNLQHQAAAQAEQHGINVPVDAKQFTEQLRGNPSGLLKNLGVSTETIGNLRNMAMPTFQNILQTIAPPISSHERLAVHITHDLVGYPSLDPTIYRVFERVMAQVEGGDLLVVQRGEEAGPKRSSRDVGSRIGISSIGGAWGDGPWWRASGQRSTNAVRGLVDGTKLARANAEGYAADFFKEKGGVEEAAKRAAETLTTGGESNPTRDSQIFLAVQAITQESAEDLFLGASADDKEKEKEAENANTNTSFLFAIYLHDPIHGIAFHALSQSVPMQWVEWLDAPNDVEGSLPESIQEIIEGGGVDPREWVSEWLEETLSLAAGVVAQRYVARRMGVGEVVKGKGKLKADMGSSMMAESGGGEAARAGL